MAKREKIVFAMMVVLVLAFSVAGCDSLGGKVGKRDKDASEFVRGPEGLVMSFVPNYPQDKFIVSKPKPDEEGEPISILVEVRNKGTYPPQKSEVSTKKTILTREEYENRLLSGSGDEGESIEYTKEQIDKLYQGYLDYVQSLESSDTGQSKFPNGMIHLSGFDGSIIKMNKKSIALSTLYLPAASSINPLGGLDTAEFDGNIVADNILIDSYNPTILVTACYPYFTKSTPMVCIDPEPFDTRQEKVCNIGSQTVPNQGAPIAVTRIDQEAAAGKIQFKISIENVGDGDVIWDKAGATKIGQLLDRCNPNEGGRLDRKDFDRVQLEKVQIGNIDLMRVKDPKTGEIKNQCSPFADDTKDSTHLVRLFDGEGFVICTLDVKDLGDIQSAYTTPIDIELRYAYRSTISKPIQIKKLETVGG